MKQEWKERRVKEEGEEEKKKGAKIDDASTTYACIWPFQFLP